MTVKETAQAPLKLYFVTFAEGVGSVNLWKTPRLGVFFPAEVQAKNILRQHPRAPPLGSHPVLFPRGEVDGGLPANLGVGYQAKLRLQRHHRKEGSQRNRRGLTAGLAIQLQRQVRVNGLLVDGLWSIASNLGK